MRGVLFFFSSRRRHTRYWRDWSSDVCSSDLASDPQFLGMLGMHGTYEANLAMHECDVMINIGARFDDRITGRLDAFSPFSKRIHVDIDPSSINKTVKVDIPIVGDCAHVLEDMVRLWRQDAHQADKVALKDWWGKIGRAHV